MRVIVLGAGIVGLACAHELVRAGHDVEVLDPSPAQGATHAAAGMLAPAGEAWHGEEDLFRLGLASAAMWPELAASLEADSGHDIDLRLTGTLLVGYDADDLAVVRRTHALLERHGVEAHAADRRALAHHEPALSRRAAGGVLLPHDHAVNPRRTAAALQHLLGDRLQRASGEPWVVEGRCRGVIADNARREADVVVAATGSALHPSTGAADLVRPVRGEVLRVRSADTAGHPIRTIRAEVHGMPVYVVPRAGGEVVVGATSEEPAPVPPGEERPTVGGVSRLLDAARALVPGLERAEVLDVLARSRPATPDNGPLIGPSPVEGLLLAAGHHRGGVLLAPVTARAIAAYVAGAAPPDAALPFVPSRFQEAQPCRSA
jgi:glycine oxidase